MANVVSLTQPSATFTTIASKLDNFSFPSPSEGRFRSNSYLHGMDGSIQLSSPRALLTVNSPGPLL